MCPAGTAVDLVQMYLDNPESMMRHGALVMYPVVLCC